MVRVKPKPRTKNSKNITSGRVQGVNDSVKQVVSTTKDAEKRQTKKSQKKKKGKQVAMGEETNVFHRFLLLPPELRHLIYSKMILSDRAVAAKVCPEMKDYFTRNRIQCGLQMFLKECSGEVVVMAVFGRIRHGYVQATHLPSEMAKRVERELNSNIFCQCHNCRRKYSFGDRVEPTRAFARRDFVYEDVTTLFEVFNLVDLSYCEIKSAPIGGLVDILQPNGRLAKPCPETVINYHLHSNLEFGRNEPNFKAANWGRWLDWCRPYSVRFDANLWYPDGYQNMFRAYIHRDLFDLKAIRNAGEVQKCDDICDVDFTFAQISRMKATTINLQKSLTISPHEMMQFWQLKIKQWLSSPRTYMMFGLESAHGDPMKLFSYQQILEPFRKQLRSDDFRVYPNYRADLFADKPPFRHCITIRCISKTTMLTVYPRGLTADILPLEGEQYYSADWPDWPEQHGLPGFL